MFPHLYPVLWNNSAFNNQKYQNKQTNIKNTWNTWYQRASFLSHDRLKCNWFTDNPSYQATTLYFFSSWDYEHLLKYGTLATFLRCTQFSWTFHSTLYSMTLLREILYVVLNCIYLTSVSLSNLSTKQSADKMGYILTDYHKWSSLIKISPQ